MRIIGCDLCARQQTVAMLDTTTGEVVKMTLAHEGNTVQEFYSALPGPERVGIEATGSMQWFVNLMEELGIECCNHADRLVSFVSETAEHHLARALLRLGHKSGYARETGVGVDATNEHMGALANISPFTASRLLNRWERSGTVAKRHGKISIHYPERPILD